MKLSNIDRNKAIWCIALTNLFVEICMCEDLPPVCPSDIYCHGSLLDTVQMAKLYNDSKTFVDMKMKYPPNITMQYFNKFVSNISGNKPSKEEAREFVTKLFEPAGQEFEDWDPKDWTPNPKFLSDIKDEDLRRWATSLNAIWKVLGRKMKATVKSNQELYSVIWVPNPVIVPGGRFREFYYWDSYWIIQGLLHSEMYSTVQGMLENFLHIVKIYGHVPNGGRVYYIARSQPPLLIPMVKLYLDFTKDKDFVSDSHLRTLEKEFDYWMKDHSVKLTVKGKEYTLAKYGDKSRGPRPESYSEDVEGAKAFNDDSEKEVFYSQIKAAAEAGWDFSSRWFITNATNKGNLTNINTRSIIPVDLNAILYWNAKILSEFNLLTGDSTKAENYARIAEQWEAAVTAVLWHEEIGAWLDYDIANKVERNYFYASNISPLWTGCYKVKNKDDIVPRVLKYMRDQNILHPGGIPTSLERTGEQWDYPNAWPPLQHIIIVGLSNTGHDEACRLAFELTQRWVYSNYRAFDQKGVMYEKYDASTPGLYGGGGEYETQLGFGWTNGVILDLLSRYSTRLSTHDPDSKSSGALGGPRVNLGLTVFVSFLVSFLGQIVIGAVKFS